MPAWASGPNVISILPKKVLLKKFSKQVRRENKDFNVWRYDLEWNDTARAWLKKHHLSWLKPEYTLPRWTIFRFYDIGLETRNDAYEYDDQCCPRLVIVLFGHAFSWKMNHKVLPSRDGEMPIYWYCMEEYSKTPDLLKLDKELDRWGMGSPNGEETIEEGYYLDENFVQEPYRRLLRESRDHANITQLPNGHNRDSFEYRDEPIRLKKQ